MADVYPPGYEDVRNFFIQFVNAYNRLEVEGLEHVPPPGEGALICCNHDNYSDPFFVATAVPTRYLRFLGWQDAFNWPIIGPFAKAMGGISVPAALGKAYDKSGADASIQAVADAVRQGEIAVIFPEGRIKPWLGGDALKRFKLGAVRAAAMAKAPIIPMALYGTRFVIPNLWELERDVGQASQAWMDVWAPVPLPVQVLAKFGEPLSIDPKAAADKTIAMAETARLRKAIFQLRQELRKKHALPSLP